MAVPAKALLGPGPGNSPSRWQNSVDDLSGIVAIDEGRLAELRNRLAALKPR